MKYASLLLQSRGADPALKANELEPYLCPGRHPVPSDMAVDGQIGGALKLIEARYKDTPKVCDVFLLLDECVCLLQDTAALCLPLSLSLPLPSSDPAQIVMFVHCSHKRRCASHTLTSVTGGRCTTTAWRPSRNGLWTSSPATQRR